MEEQSELTLPHLTKAEIEALEEDLLMEVEEEEVVVALVEEDLDIEVAEAAVATVEVVAIEEAAVASMIESQDAVRAIGDETRRSAIYYL